MRMSENSFFTPNFEPWKIKVLNQLRKKTVLLHDVDSDRRDEKSFVGVPSIMNFYECLSIDDKKNFCIIPSSNFFARLILNDELSRKVTVDFHEDFGTNDPEDVLKAIWKQDTNMILNYGRFRKFIEHEHYAWIVEYDGNGVVGDKYLRLDLFRHIIERKGKKDFQGGLLHIMKHFSCCKCGDNDSRYYPLSFETNNDIISGTHYILRTIIEAFFMSQLKKEDSGSKIRYTAKVPHKDYSLIAVFYYNEKAGVHFVDSLHIKK